MIDVVMPQMGESIVEGTLTKWLKKAGDHVERDEPLFEISTDKVDTEIPSPVAGTLSEIMVEEGKTVGINTIVGRISDGANGAAPAASSQPAAPLAQAPQVQAPQAPVPQVQAAPEPPREQARQPQPAPPQPKPTEEPAAPVATVVEETAGPLSPLVRKMARESNIDLSKVKGTGAGGRITKQDLEASLASVAQPPPAPSAPASCSTTIRSGRDHPRSGRCSATGAPGILRARRSSRDADRKHERHAPENRRAHGVQQTHFSACDHRSQGRHDARRQAP